MYNNDDTAVPHEIEVSQVVERERFTAFHGADEPHISWNRYIRGVDMDIADVLEEELSRQRAHIELIASENFVSPAVMAATGSWLTNKYAEGYPGKRYYGGCNAVDKAERLAIDRAKELFGAEHANVQPHSGAQANMAVFFAVLNPGDTILGMNLAHGGHLTHGSPVNISGKQYNIVSYGVNKDTGYIEMAEVERLAYEHRPRLIIAGASAYSRVIDFEAFGRIAKATGAYLMVDMAHIAGLVATGHHPSPVPHADFVTTTTHKTLRGPRGGMILCKEEHAKAIDKAVFPGTQGGPLMHVIAAKAVAFKEAMREDFKDYSKRVISNAARLSKALIEEGFDIVSGGTDNHLMLVDLRPLNSMGVSITGKEAEKRLGLVNITVNKNSVPFETESPFVTSGIRLGTPAVTTRGFLEPEMDEIAAIIALTIKGDFESIWPAAMGRVKRLTDNFPLYPKRG